MPFAIIQVTKTANNLCNQPPDGGCSSRVPLGMIRLQRKLRMTEIQGPNWKADHRRCGKRHTTAGGSRSAKDPTDAPMARKIASGKFKSHATNYVVF